MKLFNVFIKSKENAHAKNEDGNDENKYKTNLNSNPIYYPGPCAEFLSGEEIGCGIERIINFTDVQLENSHSYIQYVFPLQEPSVYNLKAPVLTDKEIEWIKNESGNKARINLQKMFIRMLKFYGFQYYIYPEGIKIEKSNSFNEQSRVWLTRNNHNYKRLTRIFKCLMICGLKSEAEEFFAILEEIYKENKEIIGENTFNYWKGAINR